MAESELRNWELMKPLILKKWPKVQETRLDQADSKILPIAELIQEEYQDMPQQSIIEELKNLNHQIINP